jgi:L-alanine-DL-glutamate epimerase-like enolase superfamily enzyme
MKIFSVSTAQLKIPLNKPMRTRYADLEHAFCLLIKIQTDNDITGEGLIRSTSLLEMNFINKFVSDFFMPLLIDKSFDSPEEAWNRIWLKKRNHLQSSYGLYAFAGIDIALWDIYGKQNTIWEKRETRLIMQRLRKFYCSF